MGALRPALALGVTAAVASCSALTGVGDLNEAPCAAPPCGAEASSDATTPPASDARATETGADTAPTGDTGPTSDTGLASDASLDGTTGDAPAPGWCALHPGHTLCADFDESSLTAGWTGMTVTAASSATLDSASFSSPPSSFLATIGSANGLQTAWLDYQTGAPALTTLKVAFDFQSVITPTAGSALRIACGSQSTLLLHVRAGALITMELDEQTGGADGGLIDHLSSIAASPVLGVWGRFEITVDFAIAQRTVTVLWNGASALSTTLHDTFVEGIPLVRLGLVIDTPGSTRSVRYDNVTIDAN